MGRAVPGGGGRELGEVGVEWLSMKNLAMSSDDVSPLNYNLKLNYITCDMLLFIHCNMVLISTTRWQGGGMAMDRDPTKSAHGYEYSLTDT